MDDIAITWPRPIGTAGSKGHPINTGGPFVAAVSTSEDVVWVEAECWGPDGLGSIAKGRTLTYMWDGDGGNAPRPKRWLVHFGPLGGAGPYELRVTALSRDCATTTLSMVFAASVSRFIDISSHYNGEDVTDQAFDFLAYGNLTARPLGAVTMTNTAAPFNVVYPTATYSDHTSLFFWSAQFPTIPPGIYTLHVNDSTGASSDNITGLIVT